MRKPGHVGALLLAVTSIALARATTTVSAARPNGLHSPLCSIIVRPWVREEPLTYVIIEASGDTIPATVYRRWIYRLGYPADTTPPLPVTGSVVYGQRTKILRAVGLRDSALAVPSTAALVEWGNNSMCQPVPPLRDERAISVPAGTVALLVATPHADTIAPPGVVVVHLYVGSRFYSPQFERQARPRSWRSLWLLPGVLTIEEYESLLRSLPNEAEWENAPARALATVRAWASANPALARREPARTILRGAREEADWRLAREGT
jgi:hypothetical protein